MSAPSMSALLLANRARYADGTEVSRYLTGSHHQRRLRVALDLLESRLASAPASDRPSAVLELGAGTTASAVLIAERGHRVLVTDVEPRAVSGELPEGVERATLDAARRFPLGDATFDGVFAGELIEHLFDTRLFLGECLRVLRPGGSLVLTTPNLAGAQDRLRFLAGRSPRQVDPLHEYLHLHVRPFTASKLEEALRVAGFEDVTTRSNHLVWRFRSGRVLRSGTLGRLLPSLGASLIVAARRPR